MLISLAKNDGNPNFKYFDHCEEIDFEDLPEKISNHKWSPHSFEENRRSGDTFIGSSRLLVFDVDCGLSLDEAIKRVKQTPFSCVIGTTRNHQIPKNNEPARDRFRVIFKSNKDITNKEVLVATLDSLSEIIPRRDTSCDDVARFFFPCKDIVFTQTGTTDVEIVTATKKKMIVLDNLGDFELVGERQKLRRDTLEFIAIGRKIDKSWHQQRIAAAYDFKACGYSLDECLGKLNRVEEPLDSTDIQQVRDIYENRAVILVGDEFVTTTTFFEPVGKTGDKHRIIVPLLADYIKSMRPYNTIVRYNGEFYIRNNSLNYYEKTDEFVLEGKILTEISLVNGIKTATNSSNLPAFASIILKHIVSDRIFGGIKTPFDISTGKEMEWVAPLKNGYINIKEYLTNGSLGLKEYSENIFNTYVLPFDYDPLANDMPKVDGFLNRVQPDEECRQLLKEWISYQIVPWTGLQKFMVFLGDGSNGKGVVFTIIRTLLGNSAVSSVGPEAFNGSNRFALIKTENKLANLCDETSEMQKSGEEKKKQYVGGGAIYVEEKGVPGHDMIPTARLTEGTNEVQVYTDRTNGLWRRALFLPFDVVIPDSEKNVYMLDSEYWLEEMPALFNMAISELKTLWQTKQFTLPFKAMALSDEIKGQQLPEIEWFYNNFVVDELAEPVPACFYFKIYKRDLIDNGRKPMCDWRFYKQLKRILPCTNFIGRAKRSYKGVRYHSQIVTGIRFIGLIPSDMDLDFSQNDAL